MGILPIGGIARKLCLGNVYKKTTPTNGQYGQSAF
jgi:hypothetical protein